MTTGPQWPNLLLQALFVIGGLVLLPIGVIRLTSDTLTGAVVGVLWVVGGGLILGGGLTLLTKRRRKRTFRR